MAKNYKYNYDCIVCGTSNVTYIKNKRICSNECRKKRYGRYNKEYNISSNTVGAISELMISVDLMKKGYSVFRSLSPNCFCDILAIKNDEVRKIEIRTGYLNLNGKVTYPMKTSTNNGKPTEYGVYIRGNNTVHYFKI